MAQADGVPNFGAELPDSFRSVNSWVSNGIAWIDDVQQFYRERAVIEKEYAAKLSALAKRFFEKKARKASILSVGETPAITPGSLESASMATWTTQLNTLEKRADEHDKFGNLLVAKLADPLRAVASRYEELRKAHVDFSAKLEKERDSSYTDLRKMKGKYDVVCQEVENKRKRNDGTPKAQGSFQAQVSEMGNVKNTYIIAINVTNKQKELYYHQYVPELLNSLQDLNETKVDRLNTYWLLASRIENDTLLQSSKYMEHLTSEIPRNVPHLDSLMYARHNAGAQQIPGDMSFEPSPVWHDENNLAIDESAKNFLRNVLLKSKTQLVELKRDVDGKRREVESARKIRKAIRDGTDQRDEVEVVKTIFQLQESLHESERQKYTAEVEISTITSSVGDVSIGARNHNFKSETFTIPTHCDYCGDRIWGLSAKGFICRDCGFTCHSKCEMKVPAECPGELNKEEKKRLKLQRQESAHSAMVTANGGSGTEASGNGTSLHRSDTISTLSSGYSSRQIPHRTASAGSSMAPGPNREEDAPKVIPAGPRKHRLVAPPPTVSRSVDDGGGGAQQRAKVVFAFEKNGADEISVAEGEEVTVLETDDGSGWIKVRSAHGSGIIPAAYVELLPFAPSSSMTSTARPASSYSNSSVSVSGNSVLGSNSQQPGAAAMAAAVGGGGGVGGVKKKGPAVAPRRGAKKLRYVEALYGYAARTDLEHGMREGERFVLVAGDAGDGWASVEKGGVVRSVPANYVQEVL